MKKIITLCMCLFTGLAIQAQSDFPLQFVDKDGQVIPDGTELDITEFEVDELFGDILMPTDVWVKNNSSGEVYVGGTYTVKSIDNGWFQTCFPSVCMRQNVAGTYTTGTGAIQPGQIRDMQTEWFPESEGTCIVTYQLQTYRKVGNNYMLDGDGPTITLNYYYGTTGIGSAKAGKKISSVTYYGLSGQKADAPQHGVYMKKTTYTDGTSDIRKCMFR